MLISRPRPRSAGSLQPVVSGPQHSIQPASGTTFRTLVLTGLCALGFVAAANVARAQDTFRPPPPVTYTEKYEVYGGINFMNGQAGQDLPKRYNMAGGEVMGTYWLTPKYGVAADVRWEGGTTPVLPAAQSTSPSVQTRPFVSQTIYMGGLHYHLTGNQLVGMNLHALAGAASGNFDHSNPGLPSSTFFNATGLYTNRTSAMGVAGASFDFNRSSRLALRISPEIVFEHFGNELREFVYVSGGVLYRFGNR
ncbi:hypothetical protein [Terriglobus roseus]|uniref:Outer membrane protein beta-barrel domain-containing protein n=1 Tax=Terriglobus roseus TaxID=392734 RepID=A0A1H4QTJ7_9BACT|nr:hypothetical protein [Terriglobus roseus]SEC22989.1 hypothetical protein SAMN05443244_2964 [Terriglobus roseus]